MAANLMYAGTGGEEIDFGRPVGHIIVNVVTSTISMSFDQGNNYITIPVGFHDFPIGPCTSLNIGGTGSWQLVAVQS